MDKPLKVLSVGGGWVANNRHLTSLKQNPHFELVGVISDREDRARATAKRHQAPFYDTKVDFSQARQAEADAVIIGTVPEAHAAIAKAALEAGKHVLTEKPMTVRVEDGEELLNLAKEKGKVLAVVHNFQFSRAAHRFRKDLAAGRIGNIRAIYGVQLCNHARNIPGWCNELPLGLFFDESPHFYYLFRWLSGGQCELLNASVWRGTQHKNTPRMVSAEYRSGQNYPLFLHINFDSSLTEWHVTIVGDKGTADIDVWRDIYVYLPNDGVHTARDITRTSILSTTQHLWGVFTGGLRYARGVHLYGNPEVQERFYRATQGEDSLQGMSAEEGVAVVRMQHELIDNAQYYD